MRKQEQEPREGSSALSGALDDEWEDSVLTEGDVVLRGPRMLGVAGAMVEDSTQGPILLANDDASDSDPPCSTTLGTAEMKACRCFYRLRFLLRL